MASAPLCKICIGPTDLFGSVDLNHSCEDGLRRSPVFRPASIPVPYYRCRNCEFLFTPYFDSWSLDDFNTSIYNDDYHLVDPEAIEVRPRRTAQRLMELFPGRTILDYGGGNGFTAYLLRNYGFSAQTYDPFEIEFQRRPTETFDVVSCVEVLEHVVDPQTVVADIVSFVKPNGWVRFTTHLQPEGVDSNWWYIGPRNGHISLFSKKSLDLLWQGVGFVVSDDDREGKFLARRAR